MNNDLKISVITVTYNCSGTVERTLKSVFNQDYRTIEYIVIDGASTDGTCEIINGYSDKISYYCSEKDSGIYDAMNKGIAQATGDLVLFINGDDYLASGSVLSDIVNEFEKSTDSDIIIGKELINGRTTELFDPRKSKSVYFDTFFPHQATVIRKRVFDEIGLFDEHYRISADYEWILRAHYLKKKITWIDLVISVYSSGGRSASIDCVSDEYLISTKYLSLSGEDALIRYADAYISKIFCEMFLWELMNDPREDGLIRDIMKKTLPSKKKLYIWGAGKNGKLLCAFLKKNKLEVTCFFDSDEKKCGELIYGVPIAKHTNEEGLILISSKDYEDAISESLDEKGLEEWRDYLKYSSLAQLITKKAFGRHGKCHAFFERTQLDISKYIYKNIDKQLLGE